MTRPYRVQKPWWWLTKIESEALAGKVSALVGLASLLHLGAHGLRLHFTRCGLFKYRDAEIDGRDNDYRDCGRVRQGKAVVRGEILNTLAANVTDPRCFIMYT